MDMIFYFVENMHSLLIAERLIKMNKPSTDEYFKLNKHSETRAGKKALPRKQQAYSNSDT